MNQSHARTFGDKPAVREKTPLLVGLVGPSGTGKTFSALRLAAGVQRVSGGDVFVVDTEARRALHYADRFKFRHVQFDAPFGPLDYLAAIEHCVRKGAGTRPSG
jgi:predicted ABC-type transport system involved in lysophospholipase L1 biosynthesis ATPase subunit